MFMIMVLLYLAKAWEIREKLKEYGKHYQFLSDWVENSSQNSISQSADRAVLHFDRKMIIS